ncbi:MAG: hypothetical protein DRO88_10640 [Promethearchaeia archaeon]|nr:MAG: hypothetical protein DRO88_10640 [Candidatus Lokiarchaeia archaeon]
MTSKFFHTREYFPIEINFGDKETLKITKRPRKTTTEIIDIYANDIHIGMFVGIERRENELHFGPTGLNKSHIYRNILAYVFVRLLEYFGLSDIAQISIDSPEDPEFKRFLLQLGFYPHNNLLILELNDQNIKTLMEILEKNPPTIKSQVGQLHNVIALNLDNPDEKTVNSMVDKIVDKIKNMDPLGKEFWDNRKVMQLNYYLTMAILNKEQIIPEEFLEVSLKTIISSLDTFNREAYLEDIFKALSGEEPFSMDYIQNLLEKLRELVPEQIKKLNTEHLREWVKKNMPAWILSDKVEAEARERLKAQSYLKPEDFGPVLKKNVKDMILALIDHYNGERIFFGMNNRF